MDVIGKQSAVAAALLLASCGGGGGDSASESELSGLAGFWNVIYTFSNGARIINQTPGHLLISNSGAAVSFSRSAFIYSTTLSVTNRSGFSGATKDFNAGPLEILDGRVSGTYAADATLQGTYTPYGRSDQQLTGSFQTVQPEIVPGVYRDTNDGNATSIVTVGPGGEVQGTLFNGCLYSGMVFDTDDARPFVAITVRFSDPACGDTAEQKGLASFSFDQLYFGTANSTTSLGGVFLLN